MKRAFVLAAFFACFASPLLLSGCGVQTDTPEAGAQSNAVGGIESITVDGKRYFFGYSHRNDRVLTPLFASEDAMAEHAVTHLAQTDGRQDRAFWVEMVKDAVGNSSLSDPEGQAIALAPLKAAVAGLRGDLDTARPLPGLAMPEHLYYLLEMNSQWPDEPTPVAVEQAAQRLGLEADDTSPWLEVSTAVLGGTMPLPKGAQFKDAAAVYLWYFDSLVGYQRHGWSATLGLEAGKPAQR